MIDKRKLLGIAIVCMCMIYSSGVDFAETQIEIKEVENLLDSCESAFDNFDDNINIILVDEAFNAGQILLLDRPNGQIVSAKYDKFWTLVYDGMDPYVRYSILSIQKRNESTSDMISMKVFPMFSHSYHEYEELLEASKRIAMEEELESKDVQSRLRWIYKFVIDRGKYAHQIDRKEDFSPISILLDKDGYDDAVCQGYALAFKLLCDASQIENRIVTGKLYDIDHMWNQVKIDGEWLNYDTTSDDLILEMEVDSNFSSNDWYYFGKTDVEISQTHIYTNTSNYEGSQ